MMDTAQTDAGGGFGLDKNARLEANRVVDAEEKQPEPLDPPFPYRVIAFDPVMATRNGA